MDDLLLWVAAMTIAAGVVIATVWMITLFHAGRPPRRRRPDA